MIHGKGEHDNNSASKRRKHVHPRERCLQKLTADPHLEFCAVRFTQDDIVRVGLLTQDDRINAQMKRNTALILVIADDSWVTAGRQPRMPDAEHVQHYDCNRDDTTGCAVFWDTRVCHCKEFHHLNNTVIFKLQKAGMHDREGFLHVALMRQKGLDANDAADRAAPWTHLKHPGCAFMLGPTRNMLYARTTEEPTEFAHLRKFSRQTITETQITRDTQTQTLTITAALNTDMCTITTVAERALQRAIEEYRLQRPELVRTEFHSRSLEGIAGQLEQEELRQEKRDRYIDQICAMIREGFP